MCGIVGYIGGRNVKDVLINGMRSLEYRGYDSAGVALMDAPELHIVKGVGKVADLERILEDHPVSGSQGIGHTRWATHGGVTEVNAHPHSDLSSSLVLVHNGIVENYREIRRELAEGACGDYKSETDTEVVAELLSRLYSARGCMVEALVELYARLSGSFALVIMAREAPGKIYCLRKGSPLVVGTSPKGETLCASDVPAILPYTQDVVYLDDGDIAELSSEGILFWNASGEMLEKIPTHIDWDVTMVDKGGYPHFMLKEINEQGAVLRNSMAKRLAEGTVDLSAELPWTKKDVASWKRLHIVACGTSYYAALVAERFLETITDFDIRVDVASEYRYRNIPLGPDTLAVFVSQSGETADTLAAERIAREKGARCLAVTNVIGSTIAREVHDVLQLKAGPEIGVAATKTFMGQMAVLYLLAIHLAKMQGKLTPEQEKKYCDELTALPYKLESVLLRQESLQETAMLYNEARDFLFLGRGISYPVALEGALKLKEISYVHAEAYAAGEMKHGPIALLDPRVPVVVISPKDGLHEKTFSNILEAKARKSPVIAIATEGDDSLDGTADHIFFVPETLDQFTPFLTVAPLQLFSYFFARFLGCHIDQPRNLAKSVTVE
ncbi:glucosamine--fructose-6-phosphate aminotransferase (isomerizing) [Aminivibrio pyruvatiphilus]|jgi:glucosamine--fructose-6-phosphate aminotransferase (isomerizing)|uniref:Glutamine--fructose-6-phosphate aminotransferase [isomerizing] n=1 Tax=Aminivibrio pyruvatiphilus TaxID=1005740 RepID=A0A4R8M3X6_9BACT|nr:glutamine--fructose-6-phosphate transaminase (isomerizing) [Aminivibrio pyruvatiphilus]TDY59943.1 glucosamine--fructose-6-phosphate aminotransferase (isomerizing) [Aminivibrio pyruvatiphilus]